MSQYCPADLVQNMQNVVGRLDHIIDRLDRMDASTYNHWVISRNSQRRFRGGPPLAPLKKTVSVLKSISCSSSYVSMNVVAWPWPHIGTECGSK